MVRVLLERGASVNAKVAATAYRYRYDYVGTTTRETHECKWVTPLHNAAGGGHADVAAILLDRGADLNIVGMEELHSAQCSN